jgi:hypothetical protein
MSPDKNAYGDDTPSASDHYQKIRFPSLVGFTVTGAEDGEKVTVATRINCKTIHQKRYRTLPGAH